jgi:hypothetical protein
MAVAGRAAHPVPGTRRRRRCRCPGIRRARDHAARVLPAAVPAARSAGTPVSGAGDGDAWRAVLSLLAAAGSAEERHDGKVAVTIGSQTEYFDPPRHKDIDTQAVVNLRQMLTQAG